MVEGGMKCVKYVLFAFNLIFFLAGLGLIITGAVVQTRFSTYFDFFGGSFSAVAIIFIVVGSIIFVIGFFGCCGAYKENYCMTMTFAVLLGIIFLLEIAVAIAAYVMRDEVQDFISDELIDAQKNYNRGKEFDGVTRTWDVMQHDIECCGVNNYTDWGTSPANVTEGAVPDSCCIIESVGCGAGVLSGGSTTNIYKQGCIDAFEDWVEANIYTIGGVGIGLAFIQIFGVIIACCLARTIRKEYEVV